MKRILFAIAAVLLFLPIESKAACTAFTSGFKLWSVATSNPGTGCTSAADAVSITGGNVVVSSTYASPITMTTGSITIDGGTLTMGGNTAIGWSGDGGFLHLKSGKLVLQGSVVSEGRVVSVAYTAGPPTTTTITLPDGVVRAANTAAAGICGAGGISCWVRFPGDDPADSTATIHGSVQVGEGDPTPGTYRWEAEKYRWYPIKAVNVTNHTIEYYNNPAVGLEAGPGDTGTCAVTGCAYTGTRGAALIADTALSSNVRQPHGLSTQVKVTGFEVTVDGDLTDQVMEFTSGICDGWRVAILDSKKNAGDDTITVAGDVSKCGLANVQINFGVRPGSRIQIVSAPKLNFNTTKDGTGAYIKWTGGTLEMQLATFQHMIEKSGSDFSPAIGGNCNICVFAESANQYPDFAHSWVIDSDFAYPDKSTIFDVGIWNINATTGSAYRYTGPFDMTGFQFKGNYEHDQWTNQNTGGAHGLFLEGLKNFGKASDGSWTAVTGNRVERIADVAYYHQFDDYGGGTAQLSTMRHWIADGLLPNTDNSQECWKSNSADRTSATELLIHRDNLYDAFMNGCGRGFEQNMFGGNIERIALGGSGYQPAYHVGNIDGFTNQPATGAVASYPNLTKNAILSFYGNVSADKDFLVGGDIVDSVAFGCDYITSTYGCKPMNIVSLSGTFIDVSQTSGVGSGFLFTHQGHGAAAPVVGLQNPTTTLSDFAIMGGRVTGGDGTTSPPTHAGGTYLFLDNGAAGSPPPAISTVLNLTHGFVGLWGLSTFMLDHAANNDGTVTPVETITIDGLKVTVAYPNLGAYLGIGGGADGTTAGHYAGTGQGANVTHACVESGIDPLSEYAFGANKTATSANVSALGPDVLTATNPEDSPAILNDFLAGPDQCGPRRLGLSELGTEQTMLGDAFLSQLIGHWTTDAGLITTTTSASHAPRISPAL